MHKHGFVRNTSAESNQFLIKLRSGEIPKGSVINVQWPSGNSDAIRFHGWSDNRNAFHKVFMVGCDMSWDNGATSWFDLDHAIVTLIEKPDPNDKRWKS